jgi:hypothetical protein
MWLTWLNEIACHLELMAVAEWHQIHSSRAVWHVTQGAEHYDVL